jgi:hypothetical protein
LPMVPAPRTATVEIESGDIILSGEVF